FAILTIAGEFALDVPLAETLLAGWLLTRAGLDVPEGVLAPAAADRDCVGVDDDGRLRGRISGVPFARQADRLAVPRVRQGGDGFAALVERRGCTIEPRANLAGEPRDAVVFDGVLPIAMASAPANVRDRLWAMGATARACQMAGALQGLLARSVAYAGERVA